LVCRNEERAQQAITSLREEVPDGLFDYIHFDLTRLRTCKDAAKTFLQRETRLDILVNNAAVVSIYQMLFLLIQEFRLTDCAS
jgi:NAD(P)-dependent dehydrogenase (short-subunit alcohol dehydrogenase family)